MKSLHRFWAAPVAIMMLICACGAPEPPLSQASSPTAPATSAAVSASNGLAWDLYRQLGLRQGNLFFSPANVELALSMAYTGAAGSTAQEMRDVLNLGPLKDPRQVARAFGTLQQSLFTEDQPFTLELANSLWGQDGFPFRGDFLVGLEDEYGAGLRAADFANQPEAARTDINRWVADQTADRIPELFPAGSIDRNTRLVLANAIYFLGQWEHPFSGTKTSDRRFRLTPDSSVHVPTMNQTGTFAYAEDEDCQILALPYEGERLSMIVVLPREQDGLSRVESRLNNEVLAGWNRDLAQHKVKVYLPRFSLEGSYSLNENLSDLGMPTAFSSGADFSGMSAAGRLAISKVVHKSFIDVFEKGTEAAAATGMSMMLTSLPVEDPDMVRFIADHPFLFFIQDRESELVLFLGRVSDPRD